MTHPSLFLLFALLLPRLTSGVFAIPTPPQDHKDTLITTLITTLTATPTAVPTSKPTTRSPLRTPTKPSSAPITLHILNPSSTPFKNILLEWSLLTDGAITKKGKTLIPTLAPNQPTFVRLPLHLPDDSVGESFLQIRYHSATTLLAEQQLLLKSYQPQLTILPAGEITLSNANDIITLHSPSIRISFNRQTGWLVHYEIKGLDLLDDTLGLRPNFWSPGYNDSAGSPADSGWLTATRDPHLQLFSNTISPEQIIIRTEYTLPATTSLLHLSYTINANGEMLITQQVEPDTTQPLFRQWPLPRFGMQWVLPAGYDSITEYGPLPSTWIGIFHDHPDTPTTPDHPGTPATPDPHSRATATRTDLRWWKITDKNGNGLQFIADTTLLNQSAIQSFDSDALRISIDRPAPASPVNQPRSPNLLPMGNYRYTYKVKPLTPSARL